MKKMKCFYGVKIFFKTINVFELEEPDSLTNPDYNYVVSVTRKMMPDEQEEEITVSFLTNGSVKVFPKNNWLVSPIVILSFYFGHVKGFVEVKDRHNKVVKYFLTPSFNNSADNKHLVSLVVEQVERLNGFYNAAHLELVAVIRKKITALDKDEVTVVPIKEIDEMISNTRAIIDKYHSLYGELPAEYSATLKERINTLIALINEKYKLKPL
jgi:hypothetical protein